MYDEEPGARKIALLEKRIAELEAQLWAAEEQNDLLLQRVNKLQARLDAMLSKKVK